MPKSKKQKYITPKGATFGSLPQKTEPDFIREKRDSTTRMWQMLSRDLGLEGFYFEWGYRPVRYSDIEDNTVAYLWGEWNKYLYEHGSLIAHNASQASFRSEQEKVGKELKVNVNSLFTPLIEQRLLALNELIKVKPPAQYIPVVQDDTFEDLFPTKSESLEFESLPEDIIEVCRKYINTINQMEGRVSTTMDMETMDIERGELHNRLIDLLREKGVVYQDRGEYIDFAEKATKWYGVF